MKSALALACFLAVGFTSAYAADTCTPVTISSNQTLNNQTTCGADTISGFCGGATPTGPSKVYTWTYGGANTPSGNISVTPTFPFNVAIGAMYGGADCLSSETQNCGPNADNVGDPANSGVDGTETVALSGFNVSTTYYLIITSFSGTGADQCGTFNLSVGTLPVKLQSFNIN